MARYCIFGSGRQGQALAYFLIRFGAAERVTLADYVAETAFLAAERLEKIFGPRANSIVVPLRADAADIGSAVKMIRDHDICISALPHEYNLGLTEAAVRAGRHYCDFGFDTEIVRTQLRDFHHRAKRKKLTVIPNNGIGPGLTNIIAYQGAQEVDCDTVKVYDGGLPQSPTNALRYEELFYNLLHEYIGEQVILRDGKLVSVSIPSENEEIEVEGFEEPLEAFLTNTGMTFAAEQFYRDGKVRNYWNKTIRFKGHYQIIKALSELGFFSTTPHEVSGQTIIPLEVSKLLFSTHLPKCERDLFILLVLFEKEGRLVQKITMRQEYDPVTEFTAMQISTSVVVAIVAQMIVEGRLPYGAHLPETVVDYERMLEELRSRGVTISIEKG